ncbi:hypothetical protein D3C72_1630090 [compost metagenome]
MPLHTDFTDPARGQIRAIGRHDALDDARQRPAAGCQPALQGVAGVGDVRIAVGFGQAVDVADLGSAQFDDTHHLFRRTERGAAAQGAQVIAAPVRMVVQRLGHVRRTVEKRATFVLNEAQRSAGIE